MAASPAEIVTYLTSYMIPLPTDAVSIGGSASAIDGVAHSFSIEVFDVCAPSTTPDVVRAFYVSHMLANGWTPTTTLPYDGDLATPCADNYCWKRDAGNNSTMAVALEQVRAAGGLTVYDVRVVGYNN